MSNLRGFLGGQGRLVKGKAGLKHLLALWCEVTKGHNLARMCCRISIQASFIIARMDSPLAACSNWAATGLLDQGPSYRAAMAAFQECFSKQFPICSCCFWAPHQGQLISSTTCRCDGCHEGYALLLELYSLNQAQLPCCKAAVNGHLLWRLSEVAQAGVMSSDFVHKCK